MSHIICTSIGYRIGDTGKLVAEPGNPNHSTKPHVNALQKVSTDVDNHHFEAY